MGRDPISGEVLGAGSHVGLGKCDHAALVVVVGERGLDRHEQQHGADGD